MKKHPFINIAFIAILAVIVSSCQRWEDPKFEEPVYFGPPANKTIADIKAIHQSGSDNLDSICRNDETFIVKATVVSSDEGGNCYKYMTLQDATGGIEIAIDRTGLYNEYPVGQTVYLNCAGLVVGDYHNKYQIGWIYNGSVGRINAIALEQYLSKDGLPDPDNPLIASPIEITGSNELVPENVNCLVKIDNCKFASQYDGQPLATDDMTMDREITVNGATIIVRTSNYAKFRSILIDADKTYCLYGILSVYNTEYQLTLRTKEDIQTSTPSQNILVKDITFDEQSLSTGGWTTTGGWGFQQYYDENFMVHDASSTTCDDWLISPELSFDDIAGLELKLDHKNNVEGSPADYYQVYYSTSYDDSTFDAGDWIAFNPNLISFPSEFALSNALDISVIGNTRFRVALRYHKDGTANGTRWSVRGLKFYQNH